MLKVLKFKTHLKSNLVLDIFVLTLKILLVFAIVIEVFFQLFQDHHLDAATQRHDLHVRT